MSSSMLTLITTLGWVGALAGLVAYGMVSKGRWNANSFAFQVTNVGGAIVMFLVAAVNGVWPSAAANVAWIVIGTQTLITVGRARAVAKREARELAAIGSPAEVDLAA